MTEEPKYRSSFAWNSPYGQVIRLIKDLRIAPGLVLDLGCGSAQVAELLSDMGFKYVGLDVDKDALNDLRRRGFDGFEIDLRLHEGLVDQLIDKFAGRRVTLVLMLDVLEHIPGTKQFLRSLQAAMLGLDKPLLILSVPNVGHFDIGAKLALGRFDYTPTGLLDETHVSLFTESRLDEELRDGGWVEIAKNDFVLNESDQHFPEDHPALSDGAPLAGMLAYFREQVDEFSRVNQFIRAYALHPVEERPAETAPERPFLSVLMRTTGQRSQMLLEALTCLAAQTVDDFEVKLMVHADGRLTDAVAQIVSRFHTTFSSRVEVISVKGGQRPRPLNVGLTQSAGRYIAFLDDDDLVTGNWVEEFKLGAQKASGRIVRSITLNQRVKHSDGPGLSYVVQSGLMHSFDPTFDLGLHFYRNQSPICSFAVPRAVIEALNLRFDETLPVTEDWDFLLRAAQVAGVHDTKQVTSVYRRWISEEGSETLVDKSVWEGVRKAILHRFDQFPILLPKGSASIMAEYREKAATIPSLTAELMDQRAEIDKLGHTLQQAEQARLHANREAEHFQELSRSLESSLASSESSLASLESSLSWRVTFPIRWTLHHARRLKRAILKLGGRGSQGKL